MNGNYKTTLPTDNLVALVRDAQAVTKAISEVASSGPSGRAGLGALTAAGDDLANSVKATQDAMFRSIARPDPTTVFDMFVDNFGEING